MSMLAVLQAVLLVLPSLSCRSRLDQSVRKRFLFSPSDTLIFKRFLLSEEVSTEGFAGSDAAPCLIGR